MLNNFHGKSAVTGLRASPICGFTRNDLPIWE
jgi:hypothetical protein